jgi:hypothetical protein
MAEGRRVQTAQLLALWADNAVMVRVSKVASGAALMKEILEAADVSHDSDDHVHRDELEQLLAGEGYRRGTMVESTRRAHAYARKVAGGVDDPSVAHVGLALDRTLSAVKRAARKGADGHILTADQFETLSPTAKALVRFSVRYGDRSLDELFF